MSEGWKDEWRDHKQTTNQSWQDYHDEYFIHTHDLSDLREEIQALSEHVEAVSEEYREMRRELQEFRILLESDDRNP